MACQGGFGEPQWSQPRSPGNVILFLNSRSPPSPPDDSRTTSFWGKTSLRTAQSARSLAGWLRPVYQNEDTFSE
ncbi:hypothetical protein AAFF_G00428770 [Aldrovandia affinis]|uniref:Uncharacterized protein n=1 Tax=Aldrovandia affinis TaxID=143900 RepID=A0AAD7WIL8_9TELE|nr:hypothetical protein AAFF_G00428770 [Aldrovandia affinis]